MPAYDHLRHSPPAPIADVTLRCQQTQATAADVPMLLDTDLIFGGKAYRGRYLLCDDPVGIIGRDVLNHLAVRFDGPALEWNVAQ